MHGKPEQGIKTCFFQFARRLMKVFTTFFYRSTLVNPERLEGMEAPYIMIANHQSMMDPPLLGMHLNRYEIRFIGKRELTRVPLLRWTVKKLHMIPVSRHQTDISAMRAGLDTLKAGNVLGIFPEGTRYREDQPMAHIESGFLILALRSRVPLLPVYIHGIPSPFKRVKLIVGDPISFDSLNKESMEASHDVVKAHIRQVYAELRQRLEHNKNNSKDVSA